MNVKELKELIENKKQEIEQAKSVLKTLFFQNLKELFDKNDNVEEIHMYLNNHEFNDGDPTRFYLGYEDLTLHYFDGINSNEFNGYSSNKVSKEIINIRNKFVDLFSSFDIDNFYENIFSDGYERLKISKKDIAERLA